MPALHIAPLKLFGLLLLFAVALVTIVTYTALTFPHTGLHFSAGAEGELMVQLPESSATVTAISSADNGPVSVDASMIIEEPDQLEPMSRYLEFFDQQDRLAVRAAQGKLILHLDSGEEVVATVRERPFTALPLMFWAQVAFGLIAFIISAAVWSFRQRDTAAQVFMLAGLGFFISVLGAAGYSTRELIVDGELFRTLSAFNHTGSSLFAVCFISLFLVFPQRLIRFRLFPAAAATFLLWAYIEITSIAPSYTASFYIPILVVFLATFVVAAIHWYRTRHRPVERAALKWFLLATYIGTGLFVVTIVIPLVTGTAPVASQGMMMIGFSIMFVGIAFGITRYRLFDLDRWWLNAWSWFIGGLLVIGVDAALLAVLGLGQGLSLALSLALVGWLYFPLRQWLFNNLRRSGDGNRQQISALVQELFGGEEPQRLAEIWQRHLTRQWQVLEHTLESGELTTARIENDAQTMRVPHLKPGAHIALHHPQHGNRLFTRSDCSDADTLFTLAQQALTGLNQRQAGALEERQRVMRDLHDDLGAKLLSLVYAAENEEQEELARSAMTEMREILTALEKESVTLADALSAWEMEYRQRCNASALELVWETQSCAATDIAITARQHTNLNRVLREALSNIIRHAEASECSVLCSVKGPIVQLRIADNGKGVGNHEAGTGRRSMQERIEELNGTLRWEPLAPGTALIIELPLH